MATNKRGGAGRGQGRTAEYTDGLPVRNVNVKLDAISITIAKAIGDGEMAKGIRMAMRQVCRSRRVGDQMLCGHCGLAWDLDDSEPPKCNLKRVVTPRFIERSTVKDKK